MLKADPKLHATWALEALHSSGLRTWWKGVFSIYFLCCGNRTLLEDDLEEGATGVQGEPQRLVVCHFPLALTTL